MMWEMSGMYRRMASILCDACQQCSVAHSSHAAGMTAIWRHMSAMQLLRTCANLEATKQLCVKHAHDCLTAFKKGDISYLLVVCHMF